jgi:hypothetical protein
LNLESSIITGVTIRMGTNGNRWWRGEKIMPSASVLNVVSLYLISAGALLICLYLWRSPGFADEWLPPEGKRAYAKHRQLLIIGVSLLTASLLLQYLAVILL